MYRGDQNENLKIKDFVSKMSHGIYISFRPEMTMSGWQVFIPMTNTSHLENEFCDQQLVGLVVQIAVRHQLDPEVQDAIKTHSWRGVHHSRWHFPHVDISMHLLCKTSRRWLWQVSQDMGCFSVHPVLKVITHKTQFLNWTWKSMQRTKTKSFFFSFITTPLHVGQKVF